MKKCLALIKYKNGKTNLEEISLQGNLPFSLEEAEGWIKERPEVVEVKCFVGGKGLKKG